MLTNESRAGNPAEQDVIEAGDFRVDFRTRRAAVRGHELRLTQEEFDLLAFLIGHPKSIITPHTRLSTRWGHDQVRQSDFLRVMAQLQKKLQAAEGSSNYIRTEPWVVYRFDPRSRDAVH